MLADLALGVEMSSFVVAERMRRHLGLALAELWMEPVKMVPRLSDAM